MPSVLFIGGTNDGLRLDVAESLRHVQLPPRGLERGRPAELEVFEVMKLAGGCRVAVLSGLDNWIAKLVAGYLASPEPARCDCGVGFYCRLCGRELGE